MPDRGHRSWKPTAGLTPFLLVLPVFLYYLLFWVRPVVSAGMMSLTDGEGGWSLDNYLVIFRDAVFYRALWNTAFIVAVSVTIEFVAAFGLALLINTRFRGSGLFLFVAMIPMALPAVAVGAMWSSGLATYGWLNSLLVHVGLIAADGKIAFLSGGPYASMGLVILIDAWQVIPFMMVILLAGMQNLDPEMREAGYVFGATGLTVLRRITIPMMRPTIQTAVVLRIISAIQIWLIIVMLFGFRRIPVLLEELVFYKEVLTGEQHFRVAMAYSVLVAVVVSIAAVVYLRLSAGKGHPRGGREAVA